MSSAGQQIQTLTVFGKDLTPWTPDIDSRKYDKPGIVSGRNFKDDPDGPVSAWSSNIVNFNLWSSDAKRKVTELKIADDILYGTPVGVFRINKISGIAELILAVTVTNVFWPWTISYVGGYYYLAQYDIGLWQFDPIANTMGWVTTPSTGPRIRFLAESAGRLIYFDDQDICVSSLDDGTDFVPSLTTAAGKQTLSLVGGAGLAIAEVSDGFLVYTTVGVIKATFVQAAYVFKYDALKTRIKVWSPNAVCFVPGVGPLSIDASGLQLIEPYNYGQDNIEKPWEPLMSDYIRKNIINSLDRTLLGTMQMYWSDAEQRLFIAFSSNTQEGIMQTTFTWSGVTGKWGPMDHQHTGIFETFTAINGIYSCSYMGTDGYMRAFSNSDYSQDLPGDPGLISDYVYRTEVEQPIELVLTSGGVAVHLGTTDINGSDANPFAYNNFNPAAGLYYINDEVYSDTVNDSADDPDMVIVGNFFLGGTYINMDISGGVELYARGYSLPLTDIDSVLYIGPFRFNDQISADETSKVDTILLGMTAVTNFTVSEDWNVLLGTEDWNSLNGVEDWGAGNATPNTFDLVLRDSNDGINPIETGDEGLPVFNNFGATNGYSPIGFSGIYHYLKLTADDPHESFALKTCDFTGTLTGRVQSQV